MFKIQGNLIVRTYKLIRNNNNIVLQLGGKYVIRINQLKIEKNI